MSDLLEFVIWFLPDVLAIQQGAAVARHGERTFEKRLAALSEATLARYQTRRVAGKWRVQPKHGRMIDLLIGVVLAAAMCLLDLGFWQLISNLIQKEDKEAADLRTWERLGL